MRKAIVALLVTITASFAVADPGTQPTAARKRVRGTLIRVEGNALLIQPHLRSTTQPDQSDDPPVSVETDEQTQIRIDGAAGKLEELTPGMMIDYVAFPARGRHGPMAMLSANSRGVDGTVVQVDGAVIVVAVSSSTDEGKEIRFATNDQTRIGFVGVGRDIAPRRGSLNELAAGMRLKIIAVSGVAKVVYVIPESKHATSQSSR
jgi:hypothetical protein